MLVAGGFPPGQPVPDRIETVVFDEFDGCLPRLASPFFWVRFADLPFCEHDHTASIRITACGSLAMSSDVRGFFRKRDAGRLAAWSDDVSSIPAAGRSVFVQLQRVPVMEGGTAVVGKTIEAAQNGEFEGLFAALFFVLGFACLSSTVFQFRIRHWPETTGRLTDAAVKKFGPGEYDQSRQEYANVVGYEYEVGGKAYVGKRLSAWTVVASHNLKFILEQQLDGLQEGNSVAVYYNPSRPAKAFLKRPGILGIIVTLGFAALCFYTPWLVFG